MPERKTPVTAKTGGPYTCKPCKASDDKAFATGRKGKRYFGRLLAPGETVPECPNCGQTTEAVQA
jgi:hypothetical protein